MINVLIVDDHDIVRGWLKQLVAEQAGFVTREAASGQEALKVLTAQPPDIVLLDMELPDVSGIEVLKRMKHLCPRVPALMLSVNDEEQYAFRVLRAGASGYLNKSDAPNELVGAIRAVLKGNKYISPALAARLFVGRGTVSNHRATASVLGSST